MTATVAPPNASRTPPPAPATRLPGVAMPSVATGVAVLLASLSLSPVYASGAWFGATLLTVLAVVSAGAVATWLRAPVFLVPVIQAIVMFAALVARFTTDAPLGFLPTSDALDQLRAILAEGVHDVDQFAPPIPVTEGDTAIAALGMGCLAIIVFVLQVSLRFPVLSGLSLLAVYVVPALVLDDGAPWWSFAFVAIGFMVLLVSDERVGLASWGRMLRRSEGEAGSPLAGFSSAALRLGALAMVAAVAIPILVPALTDAVLGRHDTGFGNGTEGDPGSGQAKVGLDPFVALRKQLLSQSDTPMFRYKTDAEKPDYLRAVVLTDYVGETWRPAVFDTDNAKNISDGVPSDDTVGSTISASATEVTTTISDMALSTSYLPVPAYLSGLTASGGSWFLDNTTRTVFAENAATTTSGLTWTATSLAVQPSAAQLQAAAAQNSTDITERTRRTQIPRSVSDLASQWTQGATTNYDKAVAIEKQFQTFTYSLTGRPDDNPQAPSYLEQFLASRAGYCQQFAAAMALMAQSLGIPARVVVGFTAGTKQPDGSYLVLSRNAHAWPELFFTGIGWQRFEPTPSSAPSGLTSPAYSGPNAAPNGGTPSVQPSSSSSVKPLRDERDPGSASPFDGAATAEGLTADAWRARGFVALLLVALVVGLVPAVWRLVRRRRRLSEQAAIEDMWEELRDTARDLGVPWSMAHTPRQAVAAVVDHEHLRGEDREALVRVGRATEQARYAAKPPSTAGLAADVGTVRTALLRRADRGQKWRARLLPVSLRDRR